MQPTLKDGTVLDPKVLKVMKAIKTVEGGDYNDYTGDDGTSAGAFQWNNGKVKLQPGQIPKNFIGHAREAGLNDINDFSPASQNKVAYHIMKKWKDVDGLDPEQIAAKWNGASKDPVTGRLVYNAPEYGVKFRAALAGGGQAGGTYNAPPAPQPFQAPQTTGLENLQSNLGMEKQGFVGQLGQDMSNVGTGITKAVQDTSSGAINPASGVLQGAGAIAGGAGQAIDTTISNIPVVGGLYKGANELIGGAIQGAAQTAPGQAAVKGFQSLSPEMQGNIGAAGNIASLIPFTKGLFAGRKGFVDAMTKLREPSIKKEASGEIADQLTIIPKRELENAESRGLNPMGTILNNKDFLPDEKDVNGKIKWDTARATENLQKSIDADEDALQNLFETQLKTKPGLNEMAFNINDVRRQTMDDVLNQKGLTGGYNAIEKLLNDYFDSYAKSLTRESGREFVNLSELNNIKRDLRQTINYNALDPFAAVAKETRGAASQSIMRQVEEAAKKLGIQGVPELNKQMGTKITARDILESINNKTIRGKKAGLIRKGVRALPLGGRLVKEKPSTAVQRLARRRPLRSTARKGLVQLGVGQALANQQGQEKR